MQDEKAEIEAEELECDCSERAKPNEYYRCPKCDAEWFPDDEDLEAEAPAHD